MTSRKVIRWTTGLLLGATVVGLVGLAGYRVWTNRPVQAEAIPEQVLGSGQDGTLGVSKEFKVLERVQGKLVFALEALRTLGKSSGWNEVESVSVQLYNDDETKGPLLTCKLASYNTETKDANLTGSVQVEFPDGTFLSTEVGALLEGGKRFESGTNVVFVGNRILGSAGSASYDIRGSVLTLTDGVIVRTDDGDSLVAPEVILFRNTRTITLPKGVTMTSGGFRMRAPEGTVMLAESESRPERIRFTGGVRITGRRGDTGQDFQASCERLDAERDPAGRWQVSATSRGPWVHFITLGGEDIAFQELRAWEIRAVVGSQGLLNVRSDGRSCLNTIPVEGPPRTGSSDSVRVWFDRGAATDVELLNDVELTGDGVRATAHRARLDAKTGKVMLQGNPTSSKRVTVESEQGRISGDQAVLFNEESRVEVRGRVQGEIFEGRRIGAVGGSEPSEDQPVHLAGGILVLTDDGRHLDLRNEARMWQGQHLLTADAIEYQADGGLFQARGHVRTTLPKSAIDDDALPGQEVVLSSRSMSFDDVRKTAVYEGDVVFEEPGYGLRASRLEIDMDPEGAIERVLAAGAVEITDSAAGRTLTGTRAIRDLKSGVVLLTGEPARAIDRDGNMLSGRSLTWDQPGDRVSVSEETETIFNAEETP